MKSDVCASQWLLKKEHLQLLFVYLKQQTINTQNLFPVEITYFFQNSIFVIISFV